MNNNELLKRINETMQINEEDMVKIFGLGEVEVAKDEVKKMLADYGDNHMDCTNPKLESFLNGLIVYKRGPKESKPDEEAKPKLAINVRKNRNNVVLKKLKIVFSLSSEEMLDLINSGDLNIQKQDLSAVFRKQGHKNYRYCSDHYVKELLKGIAKRDGIELAPIV